MSKPALYQFCCYFIGMLSASSNLSVAMFEFPVEIKLANLILGIATVFVFRWLITGHDYFKPFITSF